MNQQLQDIGMNMMVNLNMMMIIHTKQMIRMLKIIRCMIIPKSHQVTRIGDYHFEGWEDSELREENILIGCIVGKLNVIYDNEIR
ncbi:hypothetical protein EJB05_24531 [Eragrostis curvula]|uniref:Uncharacterized protein n=1 Tax=Eragrostis curvula TaxID=38414 RepID=A0A5J9V9Z7_9POAL|nr:hypothetical protein EJB05_24531 [Eragrostis curvula]